MKQIFYILLFLCCISTTFSFSQNKEKLKIIYTGRAKTTVTNLDGPVTTFLRDNQQQVHFVHNGINLYCDKAILYKEQDFIEAFSNVKMIQGDTITMTAKYIEYSGKTELAYAKGEVILKEPQSTLTTEKLHFDRLKQLAYYDTNGKVVKRFFWNNHQ